MKIREQIRDEADRWQNRAIILNRGAHLTTSVIMEASMAIGTDFPNIIKVIHTMPPETRTSTIL